MSRVPDFPPKPVAVSRLSESTDTGVPLVVGRISNFGYMRAVAIAAGNEGWDLEMDACQVLEVMDPKVGLQRLPALQFRVAAKPAANIEAVERYFATA